MKNKLLGMNMIDFDDYGSEMDKDIEIEVNKQKYRTRHKAIIITSEFPNNIAMNKAIISGCSIEDLKAAQIILDEILRFKESTNEE